MRMEVSKQEATTAIPLSNTALNVDGRTITLNQDGHLLNITDWSEKVAEHMADMDGVELSEDHWLLINFLHGFYVEFEVPPDKHVLSRNLCKDQQNCRWTRSYINELFPDGAKTACRYAGLPLPVRGCD
jgi:TusE/DsrC/DsvC family sulfur relay protein